MFRFYLDPREVLGNLVDVYKRQAAFALALTLTRTANMAMKRIQVAMPQVFDRPTPATMKGVRYRAASVKDLPITSAVFVLDEGSGKSLSPAKWLRSEVEGGGRADKRMERALKIMGLMPRDAQTAPSRFAPLDQYGNLRGSFVVSMLSQLHAFGEVGYKANETAASKKRKTRAGRRPSEFFVGRPEGRGGRSGVWERIDTAFGSAIRPIIYFIKPPSYRARLPFVELVNEVHQRETRAALQLAMEDAIRTSGFKGKWGGRG